MRKGLVLGLLGVLALAMVLRMAGAARADTDDGHLLWGALQQGMIGGTPVTACSDGDFVSSTQAAVDRWNSAIGRTIFQHHCAYPQVWVSTANFYDPDYGCGQLPGGGWPWACTRPTVFPPVGEEIINPTYVRMNPDLFPGQGEDADGGVHTSYVVTHEFGHVLGHADYDFGQFGGCNFPTVIDMWAHCYPAITTPQQQDVTNYNDAYRPNAVTSLTGWSPGIGQVELSWNPSNVHAEAHFHIRRWPTGQVCCGTWIADAAKNSSGILLSGQPLGSYQYGVWGYTHALNDPLGDYPSPGDVTVVVAGTTHDLVIKYCLKFGPAPANISDTGGTYMWIICEIGNLNPWVNPTTISLSVSPIPTGCDELQQLVLPGQDSFDLGPLEQQWVLYRERFECHEPAVEDMYTLHVVFCAEPTPPEGSGPILCHEQQKLLIVHQP